MTDNKSFTLTVNTPFFKKMMDDVNASLDENAVRNYIYDRKGKNISLADWKRLNGDEDYRRIGLLEFGEFSISTVWLGVSHGGNSIFETTIFSGRDNQGFGTDPIWQERYDTEEIAIGLHQILCRNLAEIYNSTPCHSEKKRRVLLALQRLQQFLHPEEAEACHEPGDE